MNDLLNDIEKLEKLKKLLWEKDISSKDFSRNAISIYIQEMIGEKQKSVTEFEEQNMLFAEYSEYMKGVGFNA